MSRAVELLSSLPASGPICRNSWDAWYDVVSAARHRLILSTYSFGHHTAGGQSEHPLLTELANVMHRLPQLQVTLLLSLSPLARKGETPDVFELQRRLYATFGKLWTPGVRKPDVFCASAEWDRDASGHASGVNHAKFAVADGRLALITSANLTAQATHDNLEIGVLLDDPGLATRLTGLVDGWIERGALRRVTVG